MFKRLVSYRALGLAFVFAAVTMAMAPSASAQISVTGSTGANASYTTLGDAFTAINAAGTQAGNNILIDVSGNTTESASAILNASDWATLTISPSGGASRTISGSVAGHLIDLNGADNVTIDGLNTGGNSLTLSNTNTGSSSALRFIGDASNNTVTNTTLLGSGASAGAGVIMFGIGSTTGNDGNNISNCEISDSAGGFPINGVSSTGTSSSVDNSGNTLNGNNISDYFNGAGATSGIFLASVGNSGWTITNNRLFQSANRTYTTGSTHNGIAIQTGSGYTITGNTLGYANSAGTGTTNMIGLNSGSLGGTFPSAFTASGSPNATRYIAISAAFTAAGAASSIQGNTVAGYALYTSSGAATTNGIFCGICVTSGNVNIGTVTGNNIGTAASSIYTVNTSSGGTISGIYVTSANTVNIQNNIIQNLDAMGTTGSLTGGIKGIDTAGTAGTINVTNNTIGGADTPDLRMGNLFTGGDMSNVGTTFGPVSGLGSFQGIVNSNTGTVSIGRPGVGNTIRNATLNTTSNNGNTFMRGIISSGGTALISTNSISGLSSASTATVATSAATVSGIVVSSNLTGNVVSANTIQNLSNTAATANVVIHGILWTNTNNSAANNIIERNLVQNNTVASTGAAVLNGIFANGGGATYKNNMVLLGSGLTSGALIINGMLSTTIASATNQFHNNSVHITGSGVGAGSANTFGFIRTVSDTTNFRNNIIVNNRANGAGTGKHYNMSLNATATATLDSNLYFQASSIFGVIGGVDAVTFGNWQTNSGQDGTSTFANPLWTSATDLHLTMGSPARDVGVVIGTVTNDFDGNLRPGANAAYDRGADEFDGTVLPASEIQATAFVDPANSAFKPVMTPFAPQASFTNNGTANQTGVTVRYRICNDAACTSVVYNQTATIANIVTLTTTTVTFPTVPGGLPVGAYFIKATSELAGDAVPANDEISGTFTVANPLAGTYTIGSGMGDNFSSLTNNGGLFEALNVAGATGPVTVTITSNLTGETGTHALNPIAGDHALTIRPSAGGVKTIESTTTATRLLAFFGADNVTIDGSASGGTDQSLTLKMENSTGVTRTIFVGSLGVGAGATNFTLKNCIVYGGNISSSGAPVNYAVFAGDQSGTSDGADNDNLTIQNNLIRRAFIGIQAIGAGTADPGLNGNTQIIGNTVGGGPLSPADYIGSRGIVVARTSGLARSMIGQNTVQNVGNTGGSVAGIVVGVSGIAVDVHRNKVIRVAAGFPDIGGTGISIETGTSGGNEVINNMISDIGGGGNTTASLANTVVGLRVRTDGTSGVQIRHNTVNLVGPYGGSPTATVSAALMIHGTGITGLVVDQNIFTNDFDNTNTFSDASYAIYTNAPNTMFTTINYNDYFNGFTGTAGVLGAINSVPATNLTALKAATGSDPNSLSVDPRYVSSGAGSSDVHLWPGTTTLYGSTPGLGAVTVDFDGDPRLADSPIEIGADEIVQARTGGVINGGTYYNAKFGSAAGDLMTNNVTITNILWLSDGETSTNGFLMYLPCGANYQIATALGNIYIAGSFRKDFCGPQNFRFPVGTVSNGMNGLIGSPPEYTPVDVNVTAATNPSSLTITSFDATLFPFPASQSLSRNWEITETGSITADLVFHWSNDGTNDQNGNVSDYRVFRRDAMNNITNMCPLAPCVEISFNRSTTIAGVTDFSRWTMAGNLVPTASNASLSGRVTTSDGRGIRNAVVVLSGNSLMTPKQARTGSLGYYTFDDLQAGETYVVTVNSKRFTFTMPSRVVSLTDSVADINFVAVPEE